MASAQPTVSGQAVAAGGPTAAMGPGPAPRMSLGLCLAGALGLLCRDGQRSVDRVPASTAVLGEPPRPGRGVWPSRRDGAQRPHLQPPMPTAGRVLLQATAQRLRHLTSRHLRRWALTVIDGTALVAKGRRPAGRCPDRRTTDHDAAWGFSASTGWFWGDTRPVLVSVQRVMLPLAWRVTLGTRQEVTQRLPVVQPARRVCGRRPQRMRAVAADTGYDSTEHDHPLAAWKVRLTPPIHPRRGGPLSRPQSTRPRYVRTPRGRWLMKRRAAVECCFSPPNGIFLFAPRPITGRQPVTTSVSLVLVTDLIGVAYNGLAHRPPAGLAVARRVASSW